MIQGIVCRSALLRKFTRVFPVAHLPEITVWRAAKKGDTLKCPFRGEADDRAECPPFLLFGLEGSEQREDTLKCPFKGEADDPAGCPLFFLFSVWRAAKKVGTH